MALRLVVPTLLIVALAACSPSPSANSNANGATATALAATPVAKVSNAGDIVAPGAGVTLGRGWYRYETYRGQHFRWVSNDAQFVVHAAAASPAYLSFELEPGPGLGAGVNHFTLLVNATNAATVARVPVVGRQSVTVSLPVQTAKDTAFSLHVAGGGRHVPKDPRILDFRVFQIAKADAAQFAAGADIVSDPDVQLGKNWYPVEHFAGETFRWVGNDAEILVASKGAQTRRLKIVAAAGPSIVSPANFKLELRDQTGTPIQTGKIKARGTVYLSLPLTDGANAFTLHAASTGRKASNDPRVLDFRVFSLSVQ